MVKRIYNQSINVSFGLPSIYNLKLLWELGSQKYGVVVDKSNRIDLVYILSQD